MVALEAERPKSLARLSVGNQLPGEEIFGIAIQKTAGLAGQVY